MGLLYAASAWVGLQMASLSRHASPVWPATGVAICLVVGFGPRMILPIFAGAFLINWQTGLPALTASVIALGNVLEAVSFGWIFNCLMSKDRAYGLHARAIFSVVALVASVSISAGIGAMALFWGRVISAQQVFEHWQTWWVGDFLGALILVPVGYKAQVLWKQRAWPDARVTGRFLVALGVTAALAVFIFASPYGPPFLFLLFAGLLLAAVWLDSFYVYLISALVAAYAVLQTASGQGPFAGVSLNDSLLHLQIFLAGMMITSLGLGSLKQEGLLDRPKLVLLFGWAVSGMTFYSVYVASVSKDESVFALKVAQTRMAIEDRMNDYVRILESGASFIDASEHVSREEWRLFAEQLLKVSRFPGIEGMGVIFSTSIRERLSSTLAREYQPRGEARPVTKFEPGTQILAPGEGLITTYMEPHALNEKALHLDIATEKNRREAAFRARDTGEPTITGKIRLMQDEVDRPGFLIFVPLYARGEPVGSIEERRRAFLGLVVAPVILEKFMSSMSFPFGREIAMKIFEDESERTLIFDGNENGYTSASSVVGSLRVADRALHVHWSRGPDFASSSGLLASWIGFFGSLAALLLAVTLSSIQYIAVRAERLAAQMTTEIDERRRTWQALTETSPVGIMMTDSQGHCTYVNPAWERISGLSAELSRGEGWVRALHPEDAQTVSHQWVQLLSSGTFACEYRFLHANGDVAHVTGQAKALKGEKGEIYGYFSTVQDITELHQNQLAMMASSRMSSLGQMASGIAHEINNPLAIIQGKAVLLERMIEHVESLDKAKAVTSARQIGSTVQRIAKIIRGLQSISRETSAEPHVRSSIHDAIEDALELCRERFRNHGVELQVAKGEESWFFWGRTEQISQVLLNLLNNAFDAVEKKPQPWVRLELDASPSLLKVRVIDSGGGVPPAIAAKMFDPFFTSKEIGKGTGLGLSISKGIVDRHGGRLYLDSSSSQTVFVVEIPTFIEIGRGVA